MKSMLQSIAAIACVAALTACGGGTNKTPTAVAVVQPAFKLTDVTVGTGTLAEVRDLVTISYVGYLYDSTKPDFKGAKVESSIDTGQPAPPFTIGVGRNSVGETVTGWDQSILGMRVGGKRVAILPATLAYGISTFQRANVNGNTYAVVPVNSPLVYDFELIGVTKGAIPPVSIPPGDTLKSSDSVVGTGTAAATGKTLTVNYNLYLYDGTSPNLRGPLVQTGNAFVFTLGGNVIAGWNQGLVGMLVGGTRTLQIPPSLGYGATPQYDSGGNVSIPANSTLIFDIQLTDVK